MPYKVICPVCHGRGREISIGIGLGQHSLLPAYLQQVCSGCGGKKFIEKEEAETPEEFEIVLPYSFIGSWWKKLRNKKS